MSATEDTTADGTAATECGLLFNPLKSGMDAGSGHTLNTGLVTHAMTCRLLTAVRRSAATQASKPIWLEKSADIPADYHLASLAETTRLATRHEDSDVLLAYVPMAFMRAGRVRSALAALSERLVGGPGFSVVLGRYVASALRDPIVEMPEWADVDADAVEAYLTRLEADPAAAVEEVYGTHSLDREGAEDLEILARVSGARQGLLSGDPDPREEVAESDADTESLVQAYEVAHVDQANRPGSDDSAVDVEVDEVELERQRNTAAIAAYVEAFTRFEVSPVIARALATYRTRGYAAATEELKITKAPRKTLGAVAKFARHGYKAVIIMFDQFTGWEHVPDDLRLSIASAMTEMRWAMADAACVVVSSTAGETPELEEQFGGAIRVEWDFPGLSEEWGVDQAPEDLPLDVFFEAATLCQPAPTANDPVIALAMERAAGDLIEFCRTAGFAVEEAMAAGADTLDSGSLDRAPALAVASDDDELGEDV